ncbi:MAG: LysM peptidoglycan-binding domain-containing protein [Candidatus Aminicenantales bacterium]|jgi:membrane-bound lytic murein transglycosylase D
MKIRIMVISCLVSVALAFSLSGCASHPKPVKTTPGTPAQPAGKAVPITPTGRETGKPAKPNELPVLEKTDINGEAQAEKNGDTDKEASALLEEGFAAYQEALGAIDRKDMDTALAKLDEAYETLPKIKLAQDSPLLREKNGLRILIAQRIQQVYASSQQMNAPRMRTVSSVNNSIPLVENQWVEKEISSFQTGEKAWFLGAYKRSGLYKDMITDELRGAALPEQLAWVPMIESWFMVRALSTARALGMWQFISSTGYRYGLKRDKYVDERMDPVKATRAAVQYLGDLHAMFGDWTTALAAYNCGEGYVQRVIQAQRIDYLDNFWDLFNSLPWQTARYVPRFIAALMIISNPAKYGFELPAPDPPLKFETVRVNTPVKLAGLAQSLGLDPLLLTVLNPELRFDSTPNYEYDLRVPDGYGEKCLSCVATLPQYVPPDVITDRYRVLRGDSLGAIARKFRTSVDILMRLNGLKSSTIIREGQVLRIPVSGQPSNPSPAVSSPAAKPGEKVIYVVKAGDTLFTISKMFGTTVEKIKADNSLTSDELTVGRKLKIQVGRS